MSWPPSLKFFLGTVFALMLGTGSVHAEPGLNVRDGLPNLATRLKKRGELRVAYLGGSITAADGWRPLATQHLRTLLSRADVVEIQAGLPGTGSDLGACRLGHDVLRHRPDLLFVEFAVNDATTPAVRIQQTMEGIVRQVRRANPRTDICFVYTVSTPGLADLDAGRYPPAAEAMESVASHYGIPSVHFGVEVARRVREGSLVFKGSSDNGKSFSLDGVHPTPTGHRVYFEVLQRALPALLATKTRRREVLPAPLQPDNWEGATMRLVDEAMRRGAWSQVDTDDPNLRGVTKSVLPPTWRADEPGAAVEFEFTGTRLGLLGIASPDNGEFRVTLDDLPPVEATFFDAFVSPTFCRQRAWFYPGELPPGKHRVRVELTGHRLDKLALKERGGKPVADAQPYEPHRLTLCGILSVGPPSR